MKGAASAKSSDLLLRCFDSPRIPGCRCARVHALRRSQVAPRAELRGASCDLYHLCDTWGLAGGLWGTYQGGDGRPRQRVRRADDLGFGRIVRFRNRGAEYTV
jgi:hypothetical protein